MIVYIILGIIGLPVFSGGTSGLGVLFGPTGGYLLGFIAGAFVIGLVYKRTGSTRVGAIIAMVAGLIIIYLMGVIQLSAAAQISIQQAVTVGVLPFLIGDVIKIIAALIVADRIRPLIDVS